MANTSDIILCDTNILIEFFKKNQVISLVLRQIGIECIAISHVTMAELYFGALNKNELERIRFHFQSIRLIPIDKNISKRFVGLMESYSLSHRLSVPDALIAATALDQDIELYTLNVKDFRFIKNLRLWNS